VSFSEDGILEKVSFPSPVTQQKLQMIKVHTALFFLSEGCPIVIALCCTGSFTNMSFSAFHFFISYFPEIKQRMNYMSCLK
jgi:hypothetical protein